MKKLFMLILLIAPVSIMANDLILNSLKNRVCIVTYSEGPESCIGLPISEKEILITLNCAAGNQESPRLPVRVICNGVQVNVEIDAKTSHKHLSSQELANKNKLEMQQDLSTNWIKLNIVGDTKLSKQNTITVASLKQINFVRNSYKIKAKEGAVCNAVQFTESHKKKSEPIKMNQHGVDKVDDISVNTKRGLSLVTVRDVGEIEGHLFCFVYEDEYLDEKGCVAAKDETGNICVPTTDQQQETDPKAGTLVLLGINSAYEKFSKANYWSIPRL